MTRTKITFSYTETSDFEEPLQVTMDVPERGIDEMCEYFQRFLSAAGYLFENDERIGCVSTEARKSPYPTSADDIISFTDWGAPPVYDFGDSNNMNCYGVRGGMAEDVINFS